MPVCRVFLFFLLVGILGAAQAGTVYKWTDDDGSTHYGQLPPSGVEATPIETPGSQDSRTGDEARAETGDDDAADVTAELDAESAEPSEAAGTSRQQIEQACEAYQENLAVLQDPAVRRIQVGDDEVVVLDEEERQRRIEETEAFIADWCD